MWLSEILSPFLGTLVAKIFPQLRYVPENGSTWRFGLLNPKTGQVSSAFPVLDGRRGTPLPAPWPESSAKTGSAGP